MRRQVDGAQVTDCDLLIVGMQHDFGTQVRAVYHADVLIAVAQVTWIFKGNPWVACFEQHADHLAP